MTRLTRICRTVGVGIAVTTAALTMTQAAQAAPTPPTGPASLAPPPGNEMFLVGHGKGVQIYKCQSGANGTFSWVFVAPRATLTTDNGQVITHTQGPTWTAADGSTVKATATLKDPVNFDPATAKDIQQLRLDVAPNGATGGGLLGATTFIQRLNTQGGTQPPAAECKAQTADKVKEVPYQADYFFWKAAAKPAP